MVTHYRIFKHHCNRYARDPVGEGVMLDGEIIGVMIFFLIPSHKNVDGKNFYGKL